MGVTGKTHDLVRLDEMFGAFVRDKSGVKVPEWIGALLNDLGQYDPGSTAFRYGENYDKAARRDVPVGGDPLDPAANRRDVVFEVAGHRHYPDGMTGLAVGPGLSWRSRVRLEMN